MKHRLFATTVLCVVAAVALAGAAAAEDAELKTSWGVPDLQGTWDFRSITPLERPAAFGDKATLTAEEAAVWEQRRKEERAARAAQGGGDVDPSQGDVDVGYNSFWLDLGDKVSGTMRTSLVIDPPNGRLPALTDDARRRSNERYALWGQAPAGPEERNTYERCIIGFNAGPPMTPGAYNNMMEIFQSPGYVAIMTEMINDHRVIPTDGPEHADDSMRFWKGDSSGVWEGGTFVVTTKNYTEHTAYRGTGPNLVLTERFTRTGPDTLLYEYTVNDPESYEAPWTSALEMRRSDDPRARVRLSRGQPCDDPDVARRSLPRSRRARPKTARTGSRAGTAVRTVSTRRGRRWRLRRKRLRKHRLSLRLRARPLIRNRRAKPGPMPAEPSRERSRRRKSSRPRRSRLQRSSIRVQLMERSSYRPSSIRRARSKTPRF